MRMSGEHCKWEDLPFRFLSCLSCICQFLVFSSHDLHDIELTSLGAHT